jgi:hypothetical protein
MTPIDLNALADRLGDHEPDGECDDFFDCLERWEAAQALRAAAIVIETAQKAHPKGLGGYCAACDGIGEDDNANFFCHLCAGSGWIGLAAALSPFSPRETAE